jgi:hypothetical protein
MLIPHNTMVYAPHIGFQPSFYLSVYLLVLKVTEHFFLYYPSLQTFTHTLLNFAELCMYHCCPFSYKDTTNKN